MSQPGMLSHGMPPRPNDVQRELLDHQRQINQMHGMVVTAINAASAAATAAHAAADAAAAAIPTTKALQVDDNNDTFTTPGSYQVRVSGTMTVPAGMTTASVSLFTSCGTTFNASGGNVGTQPQITAGGTTYSGPAISLGTTVGAASSFMAKSLTGLTPGSTITLICRGYRAGTIGAAGDDNAHLSALAVFYP